MSLSTFRQRLDCQVGTGALYCGPWKSPKRHPFQVMLQQTPLTQSPRSKRFKQRPHKLTTTVPPLFWGRQLLVNWPIHADGQQCESLAFHAHVLFLVLTFLRLLEVDVYLAVPFFQLLSHWPHLRGAGHHFSRSTRIGSGSGAPATVAWSAPPRWRHKPPSARGPPRIIGSIRDPKSNNHKPRVHSNHHLPPPKTKQEAHARARAHTHTWCFLRVPQTATTHSNCVSNLAPFPPFCRGKFDYPPQFRALVPWGLTTHIDLVWFVKPEFPVGFSLRICHIAHTWFHT